MNVEYLKLLHDVITTGEELQVRGSNVKELTNTKLTLDPVNAAINLHGRSFNWKYFAGELAWYLSMSKSTELIEKYSTVWGRIKDDNGEANSNYGHALLGKQLKWVVDSLIKDPYSRQAIAMINNPSYQYESNKDFPCTTYLNFSIRKDKLNMTVHMRSNDLVHGLMFDSPWFSFVMQQVYLKLRKTYTNLTLGKYYHMCDNSHVYEHHYELVSNVLDLSISPIKPCVIDLATSVEFLTDDMLPNETALSYIETVTNLPEDFEDYQELLRCWFKTVEYKSVN